MPYIFIDDHAPEADEYDSNYLYYDEADLESMEYTLDVLKARGLIDAVTNRAEHRALQRSIEKAGACADASWRTSESTAERLRERILLLWIPLATLL